MDNKVLIIGGVSYNTLLFLDKLPLPHSQTIFSNRFVEVAGGTGIGKAICLKRLGFSPTLHGVIGDDNFGEEIKLSLNKESIPFFYEVDPRGTQRHINVIDAQGERVAFFNHVSELPPSTVIDLGKVEILISQHEFVVLNINGYCKELIPYIKQTDKPIWCDIHDYNGVDEYYLDFINAADFLLMSSAILPNYKSVMKEISQHGSKQIICTHGKNGATLLDSNGEWLEFSAITKYQRKNTNGAGDCFMAGLIYGQSMGYSLKKSMEIATIVSGICISSETLNYTELCKEMVEQDYQIHR